MNPSHRSVPLNIGICAAVLFVGGAVFAGLAAMKQDPPTKEPATQVFNVTVFGVTPADLREVVTGFGTVSSEEEVTCSAQVGGEIVEISSLLKVGTAVDGSPRSGSEPRDPLLRIDPDVYVEMETQAENARKRRKRKRNCWPPERPTTNA